MSAVWESSKSGAIFGAITGVGAGYIQSKANKVDFLSGEKLQLHHSDPKFMGGDPKQTLTPLSKSLHNDLHRDLNDFLKLQTDDFGNHMRPQRGNSGFDIQFRFDRPLRIDVMKTFYDTNRFVYPRSRFDFYQNNQLKWKF